MPRKPAASPDNFFDLAFPAGGLDVSTEYELQPALTSSAASNVRTYEPGTQRSRGGSRPGLAKYVSPQVGGVAALIQHLNYVVDPRGSALLTGADPALIDNGGIDLGILDPSTSGGGGGGFLPAGTPVGIGGPFGTLPGGGGPGSLGGRVPGGGTADRYVRVGGSAVGLNRNVGTTRPKPVDNSRLPARKVLMMQLQESSNLLARTGPDAIDFWTTTKWSRCRAKNEVSPPLGAWKIVSYNWGDGDFSDPPQFVSVSKVELASGDPGIALPDSIPIYDYVTAGTGVVGGVYFMGNAICLEVEGSSGIYPTPLDTVDRFKWVCFFKSLLEAP